jgi:hypothetical protein
VEDRYATALHAAIYSGCVGHVTALLNHGADPLNAPPTASPSSSTR